VALGDPNTNFCPHCGLGLFEDCPACTQRKSTFERFCHACGTPGTGAVLPAP
jgi:predicted amidophosphoribosyltransferase